MLYEIHFNGKMISDNSFNTVSINIIDYNKLKQLSPLVITFHGITYITDHMIYYDSCFVCECNICRTIMLKTYVVKFLRDKNLNSLLDG